MHPCHHLALDTSQAAIGSKLPLHLNMPCVKRREAGVHGQAEAVGIA